MLKFSFILFFCIGLKNHSSFTAASYIVIQNTNIIDVIAGRIIPHQTVIIKDSTISKIFRHNNQKFPANAKIIDGKNKFLLPGLWDMHFHIAWDFTNDSALFRLLLNYGITGIRDMGGDLQILNKFKNEVKNNTQPGPELFGAGPIIDGNPPVQKDFSLAVDSLTDITYQLDSLKNSGIDFIKVYSLLKEQELKKIAGYSKANHIPFAGHLSEYAEPETAIILGQKSIEHLNRLDEIWIKDKERMKSLAKLMRDNNTWLCPTIIIYYLKLHMTDSSAVIPELEKYISPQLKKEWAAAKLARIKKFINKEELHKQEALLKQQMNLLAFLYSQKIKLLAGSDFAGMPFVYPGFGLHKELELMVESGIPPAEVLKSATINPAIYLGIENKYSSVAPGKYADLILLDKNPLVNIKNTQTIFKVFKKGRQVK